MKDTIVQLLNNVEKHENVRVLFACESGSRAWGFPSADSDYDVRFLYIRPVDWYLSIEDKRDVIEYPIQDQIDLNGWDLRKALRLLQKSNPTLMEWIGSPIVYQESSSLIESLRQLEPVYFSPHACMHHYLSMAQTNFRMYLQGEQVRVKKYFYVLRPLLAVNWIERQKGMVPTEFSVLVNELELDPTLKIEIDKLLEAKRRGTELDHGQRIESISTFIEHELIRLEGYRFQSKKRPEPVNKLDDFFRYALNEVWH
jgi:uncharacterized protein